ncbi:hypothetical protein LB505_002851 [Fusarium chuoi]|nr:hypothetical protein LB505_002851 [Fusarium chuoi]
MADRSRQSTLEPTIQAATKNTQFHLNGGAKSAPVPTRASCSRYEQELPVTIGIFLRNHASNKPKVRRASLLLIIGVTRFLKSQKGAIVIPSKRIGQGLCFQAS